MNTINVQRIRFAGNGIKVDYEEERHDFVESCTYPAGKDYAADYTSDLITAIQAFSEELIYLCGLDKSIWNELEISDVSLSKGKLVLTGKTIHTNLGKTIIVKSPVVTSNQFEELSLVVKVQELLKEASAYLNGKRRTTQLTLLETQECLSYLKA